MHKTKDELYSLIKDIKSKEEFETEIKKRLEKTDNLFDEDTSALFIVDELGRNTQYIAMISELQPNTDCTLFGRIIAVQEPKDFKRGNGSKGKVVNMDMTDNTGICRLVLWNDDVELVTNKTIDKGSIVKIVNGYTKNGFMGIEVNVGRWSQISVNPDDAPEDLVKNTNMIGPNQAGDSEMSGELTEIQHTRAFFKNNGDFGFVTNIKIKDKQKKEQQLTLWGTKVKEIQKFKVGERVKIKNVNAKQNGKQTEIHVNEKSYIEKL